MNRYGYPMDDGPLADVHVVEAPSTAATPRVSKTLKRFSNCLPDGGRGPGAYDDLHRVVGIVGPFRFVVEAHIMPPAGSTEHPYFLQMSQIRHL
jgi:hypothetical protein